MLQSTPAETEKLPPASAWMPLLAKYREPRFSRSLGEIGITLVPFLLLWGAAWWALSVSVWLSLAICIPAAGFLVRLFAIQHDCGHGSLFKQKWLNDWTGRALGILTVTPYDVWRKAHALHHASSGNLDNRTVGAIHTLSVAEYNALSKFDRLKYRLFRNPITLFVVGPAFVFLLQNRLPVEFWKGGWRYWVSAMGTNAGIAVISGILIFAMGLGQFLIVYLTITIVAATIGVWLFYVQHQFEDTHWAKSGEWQRDDAALYGSSHYTLPGALRWITANIGIHHVHHLNSRIPFYRLPQVLKDHPVLENVKKLSFWQSLSCINLHLWDEQSQKLVPFSRARQFRLATN